MTKIHAFRAIRPTRDKAHLVASRAVASYDPKDLEEKLLSNPFTFIHIIHPEFAEDDSNRTEPNSIERFTKVKEKYQEFLGDSIFIQDEKPSLYIYEQSNPYHSYLGVIGGASVQEYEEDKIKKHEATLKEREAMFATYLDVVGFNAEPVLLCHKKSEELDVLLEEITKRRPEYEFTTTDAITHKLWIANPLDVQAIQLAYDKLEACYIADGHHRSASSVRYCERKRKVEGYSTNKNYNSFLSFFIDEERLNIMPFNRLCKTLNGHSTSSFLEMAEKHFEITTLEKGIAPQQMHDIHAYLHNTWYRLRLIPETHPKNDAVSEIDAEILTRYILSPILNIHDLSTDENIFFNSNENSVETIEQFINSDVYQIGFLLYPVTIEQLKSVADEGAIMPPKSTWIEPKMRSGLVIYNIEE